MARIRKLHALVLVPLLFAAFYLVKFSLRDTGMMDRSVLEFRKANQPPKRLVQVPCSSAVTTVTESERSEPALKLYTKQLTLTIRMTATPDLLHRFFCSMLRSAALFWSPKLFGPISLILDEESEMDREFAAKLHQQENSLGFTFDFLYEALPSNTTIFLDRERSPGYNRQLWSFFFMDLYISAPIIALMDTDGIFTAPFTPENVFNGEKLRVMGYDWSRETHVRHWDESTQIALGKTIAANFMTYFPSFIWKSTITNCRRYILNHMNVATFEEAFDKMYPRHFTPSPVNTVLTYAYYFEHNRYDWHIDVTDNVTSYNKRHKMAPGFEVQLSDTSPYLHLSMHPVHSVSKRDRNQIILQGYCEAQRYIGPLPVSCQKFRTGKNFQLFEFKTGRNHLNTWCREPDGRQYCIQLIDAHYQNFVKYCKAGMYDLDLKKVLAVEQAATEFNVTCPKLDLF